MVQKAKAMRLKTGDENYYAPLEKIAPKSLGKSIEGTISRPFKVLFQEPMLIAITVYMSVSNTLKFFYISSSNFSCCSSSTGVYIFFLKHIRLSSPRVTVSRPVPRDWCSSLFSWVDVSELLLYVNKCSFRASPYLNFSLVFTGLQPSIWKTHGAVQAISSPPWAPHGHRSDCGTHICDIIFLVWLDFLPEHLFLGTNVIRSCHGLFCDFHLRKFYHF